CYVSCPLFCFKGTESTEFYKLSLTTLFRSEQSGGRVCDQCQRAERDQLCAQLHERRVDGAAAGLDDYGDECEQGVWAERSGVGGDRKSTRLNSSHVKSSYAVFCMSKKNEKK